MPSGVLFNLHKPKNTTQIITTKHIVAITIVPADKAKKAPNAVAARATTKANSNFPKIANTPFKCKETTNVNNENDFHGLSSFEMISCFHEVSL